MRSSEWNLACNAIFCRRKGRGGRRGTPLEARRYDQWQNLQRGTLVAVWLRDRATALAKIARLKSGGVAPPLDDAKRVQQAIELVHDGCLSRAQARLGSAGLLDCADPAVRAKLQGIHGARSKPMSDEPPPEGERLVVLLREACRTARRRTAAGPGGGRNEYLRVLGMEHSDDRAKEAIDEMEEYAELFINGDFPSWYYVAAMAARLVPIGQKARPVQEATAAVPPIRPITCGDRNLAVIMCQMMDGWPSPRVHLLRTSCLSSSASA